MLTYIYRTKTYIPSRIVDPSFLCSFKLSGPTPATDNYTRTCISKKGMMSEVVVLKSVKPPSRPKVDGHECPTLYSDPLTTASLLEVEQMDCLSIMLLCRWEMMASIPSLSHNAISDEELECDNRFIETNGGVAEQWSGLQPL